MVEKETRSLFDKPSKLLLKPEQLKYKIYDARNKTWIIPKARVSPE